MGKRELRIRVRFEPTRVAKEHVRVAYELIAPVVRRTPRTALQETRDQIPTGQRGDRRGRM